MGFHEKENAFYELLKSRQDSEGIVRCSPVDLEKELCVLSSELDELLNSLYGKGIIVYVTRINKETGDILKVIQLIEEGDE